MVKNRRANHQTIEMVSLHTWWHFLRKSDDSHHFSEKRTLEMDAGQGRGGYREEYGGRGGGRTFWKNADVGVLGGPYLRETQRCTSGTAIPRNRPEFPSFSTTKIHEISQKYGNIRGFRHTFTFCQRHS